MVPKNPDFSSSVRKLVVQKLINKNDNFTKYIL